jgi:hypothetical protein
MKLAHSLPLDSVSPGPLNLSLGTVTQKNFIVAFPVPGVLECLTKLQRKTVKILQCYKKRVFFTGKSIIWYKIKK